ncbi:MAG: hypothetical protein LWY06_05000 [Firmicutes bacterium]|nr:hypothetical protein [Bacillota bacterium]
MGNIGSFSPGSNPDTDRFAYYLGQIINSDGGIVIDFIESDNLFLGKSASNKTLFFNVNGLESPNPGIRWNNNGEAVEFSSGGTFWQPLKMPSTIDGSGISISYGTDTASISVNTGELIAPLQGLTVESNKLKTDFGSGHNQSARGDHSHNTALGDISDVDSGTPTAGNILTANGTYWNSSTPHNAGIMTLSGSQTVSGGKTFSSYMDFQETSPPDAHPENTARIYAEDDGSGKTRLCVRFHTGDPVILAAEV